MWLAVNTKPRNELLAKRCLLQKNIEVYLPRIDAVRRRGGSKFLVQEPLFPGYLFVNPGEEPSHHVFHVIGRTLGVKRLLCAGSIPLCVPEDVINLIKWRIGEGGEGVPKVDREFPPGSVVAVRHGPFSGLFGVVDRSIPAKERVRVFLDFMNRQTPVEIDTVLLDRVS